jgi:hypothetical protein
VSLSSPRSQSILTLQGYPLERALYCAARIASVCARVCGSSRRIDLSSCGSADQASSLSKALTFRTCARAERRHAVPPVRGVVATLPPAVQQFGCDHRRHRDLRNLQRLRTAPVRKHHRKCEPSPRGAESTIPSQLPQYAAVRSRFCATLSRLAPARSSPKRPRARQ